MVSSVNDETANKITELVLGEFSFEEEVLKESILQIKRNSQKIKKQLLKDQIKSAEGRHDTERLKELITQYQSLIREEKLADDPDYKECIRKSDYEEGPKT